MFFSLEIMSLNATWLESLEHKVCIIICLYMSVHACMHVCVCMCDSTIQTVS